MRRIRVAVLLVFFAMAVSAGAANAASTIFVPLPPCRIADTRVAGGPITGGTNRNFKVVGLATDFTSQGGSATGCGVPGFSGVVAQVQAIAINVVAANHAGAGFLTAFAGDTSRPLASTLNFTAGTTIANGVIVPVRQAAPEGNDLKVFVNVTSDVFMDVTGYFTDITLVDGSGSGIDADTLDGLDSSAFGDITGVTAGTGLTGGGTSGTVTLNLDASAVGDITGVAAGTGLTGGGTSGDVTVNLDLTASNTWTGNTTFDPASGFALTTGSGDDINLGGNVQKGGTIFLHNNGTRNLGVGLSALANLTSGSGNTASGYRALRQDTTGSYNSASGVEALTSNTTGSGNTANGASALRVNSTGSSNTANGASALSSNTTGFRNTASGLQALTFNTSGAQNTATGAYALRSNTTGSRNTISGMYALFSSTSGDNNTASGAYALGNNTTGSRNTVLGYRAGENLTTGDNNIDIGNPGVAAEAATIRIGAAGTQTKAFLAGIRGVTTDNADQIPVCIDSAGQLGTGSCVVAAGDITGVAAGTGLSGGGTSGDVTLNLDLTASNTWTGNTTFDPGSGLAFSTGTGDDIDLGGRVKRSGTLFLHATGTRNLGLGDQALGSLTSGSDDTALGFKALRSNSTGFSNTVVGSYAMSNNTSGSGNVAVGDGVMYSNSTGTGNTALGGHALQSNTSGVRNSALGQNALYGNTDGYGNTAAGWKALKGNTSGHHNAAFGYMAGYNLTTGSENIDIGNQGVAAESSTIRIGSGGAQTRAFVAGIRGVTTDVADAVAVVIDSSGQLGTVSSSRRYKEEIHDMGTMSERLLKLRPVTFRYKKEVQKGERPVEFGLIAEEVAEVFPELVVYNKDGKPETVKYHVLVPLLLNELQKQEIQVEQRERRLERQLAEQARGAAHDRARFEAQLAAQHEQFAAQLTALLDRLAAVERRAGSGEPVLATAATGPPAAAGTAASAPRR